MHAVNARVFYRGQTNYYIYPKVTLYGLIMLFFTRKQNVIKVVELDPTFDVCVFCQHNQLLINNINGFSINCHTECINTYVLSKLYF